MFNNLNDLDAARAVVREFTLPCCAIVKHANPCGCAVAATLEEAYEKALASDPVSAYGGVVALNRKVSPELGARLAEQFVEVLIAPDYDDEAVTALAARESLRILRDRERRSATPGDRDYRRVLGGFLVQDADTEIDDREGMSVVTEQHPDETGWGDLLFAWRVAKHVASNAIVIAKGLQAIGIGGGQMSRGDAVRLALQKAASTARPPGRGARLGCALPVCRRPATCNRRRRHGLHPARRLEARRRGRGGDRGSRRGHDLHVPPPLPPLMTTAPVPMPKRSPRWLLVPVAGFAVVSLLAGFLADAELDRGGGYFDLFFSDTIHLKAWLASAAVALGLAQLLTAAWIFRKVPWPRPAWIPGVHRWTGRLAFLLTLPIAYHCIFKLGFQSGDDRVLAHSLLGCAFYGAFAAKVLVVRLHRFPGWVLPTAGGLLFATLIAVWYTSAVWFFRLVGIGL